jgi:hypothetical protein
MAFPEPDQAAVKEMFTKAVRANQVTVYYKTYGVVPPTSNAPSDFGHNLHWAAPRQTAEDVASFIMKGMPAEGTPYLDPMRGFAVSVDAKRNAWVLLK